MSNETEDFEFDADFFKIEFEKIEGVKEMVAEQEKEMQHFNLTPYQK